MPCTNPVSGAVQEWRCREALAGVDSVLDHVPRLLNGAYARPTHLAPIADLFARAALGEELRALVSAPPRFGKSSLMMAALGRHLLLRPEAKILLVSYSADLAAAFSRQIRDAVMAAGLLLRPDARRADDWQTLRGGGIRAVGIGGGITGRGGDLIVLDDIFRGRPEAESETIRDSTEAWFRGSLLTRLEPGGSVILSSVRWHLDDLHGRLEAEDGWEAINLPAIDAEGSSLWPARWPLKALNLKRRGLGEYDWASQYMGSPVPAGGSVFDGDPASYQFPNLDAKELIAVDPATSSSTRGDFSVIACGLAYRDENGFACLDVLDVWRRQAEPQVLLHELQRRYQHWGEPPVGIEAVAGFKVLVPMARQMGIRRVMELKATADKLSRSLPAAAAWTDGRIRLPRTAPWRESFVREVRSFTGVGDKRDDQVDALSHLFAMAERAVFVRKQRRAQATGWF